MEGGEHWLGGKVEDLLKQVNVGPISVEWTVGKAETGKTFFYENDQNRNTPETDLIRDEVFNNQFLSKAQFVTEGERVNKNIPLNEVRTNASPNVKQTELRGPPPPIPGQPPHEWKHWLLLGYGVEKDKLERTDDEDAATFLIKGLIVVKNMPKDFEELPDLAWDLTMEINSQIKDNKHIFSKRPTADAVMMKGDEPSFGSQLHSSTMQYIFQRERWEVEDDRVSVEWTVGLDETGMPLLHENNQNKNTLETSFIKNLLKEYLREKADKNIRLTNVAPVVTAFIPAPASEPKLGDSKSKKNSAVDTNRESLTTTNQNDKPMNGPTEDQNKKKKKKEKKEKKVKRRKGSPDYDELLNDMDD
eukprot:Platyproteum_vivax@DN7482_c0_g5_i1.p1